MNKTPITLVLLFTTLLICAQTTAKEYIYATKGYKLDLETARDFKKGYDVIEISKNSNTIILGSDKTTRSTKILKLIKTDTNTTIALIYEFSKGENTTYFCLPDRNSDVAILEKAKTDFFALNNLTYKNSKELQYFWTTLSASGWYLIHALNGLNLKQPE